MKPRHLLPALLPLLLAPACQRPVPEPPRTFQVQVSSDPGPAALALDGRPLGQTPLAFAVAGADDLLKLTATHPSGPVVEKRVRFLAMDRAEVSFTFGEGRSAMAKVLGLPRILVFDYGAGVTFDVNRAELKPDFLPLLARQADLLQRAFQGLEVHVCGHTDSTGGADHNLALSLARARAVSADLSQRGVEAPRLKVQGLGSAYPIAPNDTDAQRALNRRTEIILGQ